MQHETIKSEVSEIVEAAAVALIVANDSGDKNAYQNQLEQATGEIHRIYMQAYMIEKTDLIQPTEEAR